MALRLPSSPSNSDVWQVVVLVRVERLELPRLAAPEPKSGVSTNFTIPAFRQPHRLIAFPARQPAGAPRIFWTCEGFGLSRARRLYITRFCRIKEKMRDNARPRLRRCLDYSGPRSRQQNELLSRRRGPSIHRLLVDRCSVYRNLPDLGAPFRIHTHVDRKRLGAARSFDDTALAFRHVVALDSVIREERWRAG